MPQCYATVSILVWIVSPIHKSRVWYIFQCDQWYSGQALSLQMALPWTNFYRSLRSFIMLKKPFYIQLPRFLTKNYRLWSHVVYVHWSEYSYCATTIGMELWMMRNLTISRSLCLNYYFCHLSFIKIIICCEEWVEVCDTDIMFGPGEMLQCTFAANWDRRGKKSGFREDGWWREQQRADAYWFLFPSRFVHRTGSAGNYLDCFKKVWVWRRD